MLTALPASSYKPPIETAPPESGAFLFALPLDAGAEAGSPDGFLSEFGCALLFDNHI
jgi:hypothetical protein